MQSQLVRPGIGVYSPLNPPILGRSEHASEWLLLHPAKQSFWIIRIRQDVSRDELG